MPNTKELELMIKEYNSWFKNHGDSHESVGWNKPKHNLRFKHLLGPWINVINKSSNLLTVGDLGCGLAHLNDFIISKNILIKYLGIDVNSNLIEKCKEKYPKSIFECCSVEDIKEDCDIFIASGLFNRKFKDSEIFLKDVITNALIKCKYGVSFNVLSSTALSFNKNNFYCPFSLIEEIVKDRVLCDGFYIDGSSIPGEITVTIFKKSP